jgi:phosphotransferase system HPr (HPr) family protein
VPNPAGLHARPAALFTRTVASFDAKVRVQNLTSGKEAVAITGLISVMLLGAQQGHDLLISAEGPQAEQVISAIKDLFDHNLGE